MFAIRIGQDKRNENIDGGELKKYNILLLIFSFDLWRREFSENIHFLLTWKHPYIFLSLVENGCHQSPGTFHKTL